MTWKKKNKERKKERTMKLSLDSMTWKERKKESIMKLSLDSMTLKERNKERKKEKL